jgi:hypothetical protein
VCPTCTTNLSDIITDNAKKFPNDNMALLESEEDSVISGFYGLTGSLFEAALGQLTTDYLKPLPHYKYFYVSGSTHTMVADPTKFVSNTLPLTTFINYMVQDSPAWESSSP